MPGSTLSYCSITMILNVLLLSKRFLCAGCLPLIFVFLLKQTGWIYE